MAIVMGLDIHREQVTFDAVDDASGEVRRGRITPADRFCLRRFLASLPAGQVDVALEATTGWRFIVEELIRGRGDSASGRAGGNRQSAWTQGTREDRPSRCAPPA